LDESLHEAVEAQARARVRGDDATFASYMTPQALLQLRANGRRPRSYRVVSVAHRGGVGETSVRYEGDGTFLMRQRWEQRGGAWKSIDATQESDRVRPLWRRLFARGADDAS